jgi:3-oxoacyl-[acyl-carrier protein] reductase
MSRLDGRGAIVTGAPRDVADVVAFLASEESRWVTGQVILATGGG